MIKLEIEMNRKYLDPLVFGIPANVLTVPSRRKVVSMEELSLNLMIILFFLPLIDIDRMT